MTKHDSNRLNQCLHPEAYPLGMFSLGPLSHSDKRSSNTEGPPGKREKAPASLQPLQSPQLRRGSHGGKNSSWVVQPQKSFMQPKNHPAKPSPKCRLMKNKPLSLRRLLRVAVACYAINIPASLHSVPQWSADGLHVDALESYDGSKEKHNLNVCATCHLSCCLVQFNTIFVWLAYQLLHVTENWLYRDSVLGNEKIDYGYYTNGWKNEFHQEGCFESAAMSLVCLLMK